MNAIPTKYADTQFRSRLEARWAAFFDLDLLIETPDAFIAIECDGHDFHDRTKQQASYDRSRDRSLILLGVATIRFTGSEIHHSLERCVDEVYKIAGSLQDEGGRAMECFHQGVASERAQNLEQVQAANARASAARFACDDRFGNEGQLRGLLFGV